MGMAMILYTKFVALTPGAVYPNTLICRGSSANAPETPAVDVNAEITNMIRGGNRIQVLTPETGKKWIRKSGNIIIFFTDF